MRRKREPVLCFPVIVSAQLKIVAEAEEEYKRLSDRLDQHLELVTLAHRDLRKVSQGGPKGRKGVFTSENILRTLIVMMVENLPLRKTIVMIAHAPFLQDFVRLLDCRVMDYSFLDKCFNAIEPETWQKMNAVLARQAAEDGIIDPSAIRTDTTVVEANIHYPTDSFLLWDSWRVIARLLRRARKRCRVPLFHRFHDTNVKALHLFITRYVKSPSKGRQREVRSKFRDLVGRVRRIAYLAESFCADVAGTTDFDLQGIAAELRGFLPSIHTVIETSERAALRGEKVPASERVFSIFEPHVELIQRGKRSKPVEFGHKIVLSQVREKFISHFETLEAQEPDNELTEPAVNAHKKVFGTYPDLVTTDKGMNPCAEKRAKLEAKVKVLAIPRKLSDWADDWLVEWQGFRAGIEGTISVLKRAFRLARCLFRGFRHFASAVGLSVVCHNLVVLAAHGTG
jgi:transposase, IS5 family